MENSFTDKYTHWRDTQLSYDGEDYSYGKYTWAIIRKGHKIVVGLCEQIARENHRRPTILDLGCGWTDFYGKLQHVVGTYVGIEPAAGQLLRAEPRENQFLIRGMGEKILLRDSCVDIVLLISVLDHCLDAEKTLQEAFRVLKPGGTVIILLENRGRFANDIRALLRMKIAHGVEHLYYFSVDDILALVEPLGKVNFLCSYGFLMGFDHFSNILPEKLVGGLEAVTDAVLSSLFVKKGQHFVLSAVKSGHGEASPLVFTCPYCGEAFSWKARQCNACKHELRWMRPDILDTIDEERR